MAGWISTGVGGNIRRSLAGTFLLFVAVTAQAETAIFTLDNVVLADNTQMTGTFVWTYDQGDFEGGVGQFTELYIPWTSVYNFADGNLSIDIQVKSIEISGNGNYHDYGLDIKLVLSEPLVLEQSSSIDLGLSFFECCGNGFKDQLFRSGSISPLASPPPLPARWWRFATEPWLAREAAGTTVRR